MGIFGFIKDIYHREIFRYKLCKKIGNLLREYNDMHRVDIFPAFNVVNEIHSVSILQTAIGIDAVRMKDFIIYTPKQFIESFQLPDENGDIYVDGMKAQHIDYLIPEGEKYLMALYNYICQDRDNVQSKIWETLKECDVG